MPAVNLLASQSSCQNLRDVLPGERHAEKVPPAGRLAACTWDVGHRPCAFMKDLPVAISVSPKAQVQYLGIIHS